MAHESLVNKKNLILIKGLWNFTMLLKRATL